MSHRLTTVRLETCHNYLTVMGIYAPEEGPKEETDEFFEIVQKETNKWNRTDYLIVSADLNARIRNNAIPRAGVLENNIKILESPL